jgi:polyphosphate kinase 2 (PPK2 family)
VQIGARICVVFEGRDGAGKGGTIKRLPSATPGRLPIPKQPATDERRVCFRIERFTDTNSSPVEAHASTPYGISPIVTAA